RRPGARPRRSGGRARADFCRPGRAVIEWRAGRLLVDGGHAAYRPHPHLFEFCRLPDGREGLVMTMISHRGAQSAQQNHSPRRAMARDAANALLPAARNNLGLVPGAASGVMPGSIAIAGSPTGYAVGDTVTLTCSGCSFTTNPVVVVSAVSSGIPTAIQLRVPGAITAAPAANPTFTQSATTGSGTGLQVTGTLGVIAADVPAAGLNTGGTANGNMILGAETPLSTLY